MDPALAFSRAPALGRAPGSPSTGGRLDPRRTPCRAGPGGMESAPAILGCSKPGVDFDRANHGPAGLSPPPLLPCGGLLSLGHRRLGDRREAGAVERSDPRKLLPGAAGVDRRRARR